jgi:hypothetical protein
MGASIDHLPMTPQAIWSAVEKSKLAKAAA